MFPADLPLMAFRQVSRFVLNQDRDWGRFSLAAWEIVGFGLGKGFPNAAYLADAAPLAASQTPLSTDLLNKLATADEAQLTALSPELEALLATLGPLLLKWLLKKLGISV